MITHNIPQVLAFLGKLPEARDCVIKAVSGKSAGVDLVTKLRSVADKTLKAQWALERDVARRAFYEKLHPHILATVVRIPISDGFQFQMRIPDARAQTSAGVAAGKQFTGDATPMFKSAFGSQFEKARALFPQDMQQGALMDIIREAGAGFQAAHTPLGEERRDMTTIREGMFEGRNAASLIEELKPHWDVLHNAILQWVIQVKDTASKDKYHSNTKDGSVASDENIARNLEYALGLRGGGGTSAAQDAAAESLLPHLVEFLLADPGMQEVMGAKPPAAAPLFDTTTLNNTQKQALFKEHHWETSDKPVPKTQWAASTHRATRNKTKSVEKLEEMGLMVNDASLGRVLTDKGREVAKQLAAEHEGKPPPSPSPVELLPRDVAAAWLDAVLKAWTAELKILLRHRIQAELSTFFQNITAKQPKLL